MAAVAWKNIGVLRGVATCMVSLNHSVQVASALYFLHHPAIDPLEHGLSAAGIVLLRAATPFCVPAFMFASAFMLHKFVRTWRQARRMAWPLVRAYLFWSLVGFGLIAFQTRHVEPMQVIKGLLMGRAFPAYWFIPLIVELVLIVPLLIRLVESSPRAALLLAAAAQVLTWVIYYADLFTRFGVGDLAVLYAPISFLPFFLAGLLASQFRGPLVEALKTHRALLVAMTITFLCLDIAESLWTCSAGGWSRTAADRAFASERVTPVFFALGVIGLALGAETKTTQLRERLTQIGLSSLGILLTLDLSQSVMLAILWHLPGARDATAAKGAPALWLEQSWGIGVVCLFLAGILGPLILMRVTNRVLGKNARFVFS
jgi:surface polysaccharide O-acyltransferase-like enzyme